jgi:hypothetical protein
MKDGVLCARLHSQIIYWNIRTHGQYQYQYQEISLPMHNSFVEKVSL